MDSASETARPSYDTGAADTVLVDGYPSSFYIDVKVDLAGQTTTTTQTTTVTQTQTALSPRIVPLLLLLLGVLLVAVVLLAGALAGLAQYIARRARWEHGQDQSSSPSP